MGLLSRIRQTTGTIFGATRSAVSSIGARIASGIRSPLIRSAPSLVLGSARKVLGFAVRSPIKTAIGVGLGSAIVRRIFPRRKEEARALPVIRAGATAGAAAGIAKVSQNIFARAGGSAVKFGAAALRSPIGKVGVVGAGLFVAEQIAERLGVRGGAGFVGRRPRGKRRKARRFAHIRVPRNVRFEGRLTKMEEKRLRRMARSLAFSEGSPSRRRIRGRRGRRGRKRSSGGKRVSFTTKSGQRVSFRARR